MKRKPESNQLQQTMLVVVKKVSKCRLLSLIAECMHFVSYAQMDAIRLITSPYAGAVSFVRAIIRRGG
jgi:hypothetical protein